MNTKVPMIDDPNKMNTPGMASINPDDVTIRRYRHDDQPHIERLYTEGLLFGQIPSSDTGADIENIDEGYLSHERGDFWVAEYQGKVVGMIGVAEDEPNIAEIRRLRVDPKYRGNGIGEKLMGTALKFCRHHGYLKVVLDTRLESGPAMDIFDQFAFQHNRTRNVAGKELLEFYLDLYREPKPESDQ